MTPYNQLFDVVALIENVPRESFIQGHVVTVVEAQDENSFEVEFSEGADRTYAMALLAAEQLLVLHHTPARTI